jgi:hypothetical protein
MAGDMNAFVPNRQERDRYFSSGVPNRKIVIPWRSRFRTFDLIRTPENHYFPVWFMVPNSVSGGAPQYGGLRNHHTSERR